MEEIMDAAKLALTTFFITLIPTRLLSKLYLSNTDVVFFNKYAADIITALTFTAIFVLIHLIFKKVNIANRLPENFNDEALLAISSYVVLLPQIIKILMSVFGGGVKSFTILGLTQPFAMIGLLVLIVALVRFCIALQPNKYYSYNNDTQDKSIKNPTT